MIRKITINDEIAEIVTEYAMSKYDPSKEENKSQFLRLCNLADTLKEMHGTKRDDEPCCHRH